jgi:phosphopantetheinyl transferase
MSHSEGIVAVAAAQSGQLGIDVERHRPRDFVALAAHAFGPREQLEVASSGADGFYRIWTSREALAKSTGEGLVLAANGHDLVRGDTGGAFGRAEHAGQTWHLTQFRPEPTCSLAVAHAGITDAFWEPRCCDLGSTATSIPSWAERAIGSAATKGNLSNLTARQPTACVTLSERPMTY